MSLITPSLCNKLHKIWNCRPTCNQMDFINVHLQQEYSDKWLRSHKLQIWSITHRFSYADLQQSSSETESWFCPWVWGQTEIRQFTYRLKQTVKGSTKEVCLQDFLSLWLHGPGRAFKVTCNSLRVCHPLSDVRTNKAGRHVYESEELTGSCIYNLY